MISPIQAWLIHRDAKFIVYTRTLQRTTSNNPLQLIIISSKSWQEYLNSWKFLRKSNLILHLCNREERFQEIISQRHKSKEEEKVMPLLFQWWGLLCKKEGKASKRYHLDTSVVVLVKEKAEILCLSLSLRDSLQFQNSCLIHKYQQKSHLGSI